MTNSSVIKTITLKSGKKVRVPSIPNFIIIDGTGEARPIEQFSNEELLQLTYEWQVRLLNKAEERRSL